MARPRKQQPEEIIEELYGDKPVEKESPKERPKFISVKFKWAEIRPDKRQYNQQTLLLSPYQTWVIVDVPNTDEYVVQGNSVVEAQPELTPLGMRYCVDQLDKVFVDNEEPDEPVSWEKEEDTEEDTWDKEDTETDTDDTTDDTNDDADTDWDAEDTDENDAPWDNDTEEEFDWD